MQNYDGYLSCQTATCPPLLPYADEATSLSLSRKTKRADDLAEFLEGAPNLEFLELHHPSLLDTVPARSAVRELTVTGQSIDSLRFLSGFPELRRLKLWPTKLTDLSGLENVPKLERLTIAGAKVTSLPPMPPNLVELVANSCKSLADISGLADCTELEHVDLNNTKVDSLDPLSGAVKLRALKLRSTRVTSLGPIFGAEALETLFAERTKVKDVDGIESLRSLRLLWLHLTPLRDATPIGGLSALLDLDLSGVKAIGLDSLGRLKNLRFLDVHETNFEDIHALEAMTNLERARVGKTALKQRSAEVVALNKRLKSKHGKHAGLVFGEPNGMPTMLTAADTFCATGDIEHWQFNLENP